MGTRPRRDPPLKHNFRVEFKELIAIPNIVGRLKVPAKTDGKMGLTRALGVSFTKHTATIYAIAWPWRTN